jgi:hypothetical protein
MDPLPENTERTPGWDSDQDFENCKGRCGYTPWCRACLEERKKLQREAEQKEKDHDGEQYA